MAARAPRAICFALLFCCCFLLTRTALARAFARLVGPLTGGDEQTLLLLGKALVALGWAALCWALARVSRAQGWISVAPREAAPGRDPGLDRVRLVAAVFVVLVHAFFYNGYYQEPIVGPWMLVQTALRWLAVSAVPLYVMLTGYLKRDKRPNWAHYRAILPILGAYACYFVIRATVAALLHGETLPPLQYLARFVSFYDCWYMQLYVGLFLLLPYLNLLWDALASRAARQGLLLTLVCLTALPVVLEKDANTYWFALYPLTYYFLGAYLRDYRVTVKRPLLLGGLTAMVAMETVYTYAYRGDRVFHNDLFCTALHSGYQALPVLLVAMLVFLLAQGRSKGTAARGETSENAPAEGLPARAVRFLSRYGLEVYFYNCLYYDALTPALLGGAAARDSLPRLPLLVLTVYALSVLTGVLTRGLCKGVALGFARLRARRARPASGASVGE